MGGDWGTLKAEMLSKIDNYEKKNYWCQQVFKYYGESMAWAVMNMHFPDVETKIFACETAEKSLILPILETRRGSVMLIWLYIHTSPRVMRPLAMTTKPTMCWTNGTIQPYLKITFLSVNTDMRIIRS